MVSGNVEIDSYSACAARTHGVVHLHWRESIILIEKGGSGL